MLVIGVLNSKGGVGKSTLTAAFAVRAARDNTVCVVDLDSQGSYSDWYTRRGSPDNPALLTGEDRASDAIEALRLSAPGLPHITMPSSQLESGCRRPASGLAEAERRADLMLAARSFLARAADS